MKSLFADNPDFREYEAFLLRLARLMADGKGDTEEADAVREEMDQPWYRLSEAEQGRANELSGDLFMIGDAELYELPPIEAPQPEALNAQVQAAFQRQDWLGVLSLLRKGPVSAPKHVVAAVRSFAYERLGHINAALAFVEYGAALEPNTSYFESHIMDLLRRIGRSGEAHDRANEHVRNPATSTELLVQSALMLLILRELVGETQSRTDGRLVARSLKKRLSRERPTTAYVTAIQSSGYFALGAAYEFLNEPDEAISALSVALSLQPDDEGPLLARGLLQLKLQRPGAREDFETAVAKRSRFPLPYMVLAHMALDDGDYRRCIALCNHLLHRLSDSLLLATVLVWRAIAEQRSGMSREIVVGSLEMAHQLWPANITIARDLLRLKEADQQTRADNVLIHPYQLTPDQLARLRPSLEDRLSPPPATPQQFVAA